MVILRPLQRKPKTKAMSTTAMLRVKGRGSWINAVMLLARIATIADRSTAEAMCGNAHLHTSDGTSGTPQYCNCFVFLGDGGGGAGGS